MIMMRKEGKKKEYKDIEILLCIYYILFYFYSCKLIKR